MIRPCNGSLKKATGVRCSRRAALGAIVFGTLAGALDTWGGVSLSQHRDTILLDSEYQVIENFGASDCWSMQKIGGWSLPNRERVADLLFSRTRGIGLSCWRFNFGGGINPQITNPWRTVETFEISEGRYDWTRQANERWFLGAAKARGVPQFLAFANSPPGRITRNGLTFCDPDKAPSNLKPGFEGQFARYLADILAHFRDNPDERQRVTFDYVSPVNEPQWDWTGHSQEGNRASNDVIKAIVRSLAAELKRRQLPTQIALVESGCLPDMWHLNERATTKYGTTFGNYLEDFWGASSVNGLLSGRIGYHSYNSDLLRGSLVENRATLGHKMQPYAGWKLWQTEYCVLLGSEGQGGRGRDLTMNTALDAARIIHLDLTLAGVSAWHWWTAVSREDYKDGLIYTDWQKLGDPETIYPARLMWVLGNYSRFVRPGMKRIELAGSGHDIRGLMGTAFKDEQGRQVVAVYINLNGDVQEVQLELRLGARAWKLESITPYITSDSPGDELKAYPAIAPDGQIEMPGRAVVTLVAQFA
ncbi:MAG TPA: glycoside hydrolase [Terriglobia bacterium]